jgi:hypothetical protein
MRADAAPPVFRVPRVRLAAVHDGVHEGAVARFERLGDAMRRVQMVVPEQDERADGPADFVRQRRGSEVLVQERLDPRLRPDARARAGAEFGRWKLAEPPEDEVVRRNRLHRGMIRVRVRAVNRGAASGRRACGGVWSAGREGFQA